MRRQTPISNLTDCVSPREMWGLGSSETTLLWYYIALVRGRTTDVRRALHWLCPQEGDVDMHLMDSYQWMSIECTVLVICQSLLPTLLPTESADMAVKDEFLQPEAAVAYCKKNDLMVVLGDFNVVNSTNRLQGDTVLGPWGSGFPNESSYLWLNTFILTATVVSTLDHNIKPVLMLVQRVLIGAVLFTHGTLTLTSAPTWCR